MSDWVASFGSLNPSNVVVAAGTREQVAMYGDDWPTPDGTCVRDYIHVDDLADAHLRALDAAGNGPGEHLICNLGNGTGFSVREVVEACRRVTGHPIPAVVAPRRAGDPAVLVASARRAHERLGWTPTRGDLDGIVADEERCRELAESSPSIVTPLNKYIGYEVAAKVAKQSLKERKTIRQVVLEGGYVEKGDLTEAQLDEALDVLSMTKPPQG